MNILTWNVGGLRTSLDRLVVLLRQTRIDIVVIIEPKQNDTRLTYHRLKLGYSDAIVACHGDVWVFWNSSMLTLMQTTHELQTCLLSFMLHQIQQQFAFSVIYGRHTQLERLSLWHSLTHTSHTINIPWVIGGDFNTFLSLDEHQGRTHPTLRSLEDFKICVEECGLQDIPFTGPIHLGKGKWIRQSHEETRPISVLNIICQLV